MPSRPRRNGDWELRVARPSVDPLLRDARGCSEPGRALLPGRVVLRRVSEKSPHQLARSKHGESNRQGDKLKDEQGRRDTGAGVDADGDDGQRNRCAAPHAREDRPVLPRDEAQQHTGRAGSTVGGYDERRNRFPEAPSFGAESTPNGPR